MLSYSARTESRAHVGHMPSDLVGVAGFEPAASSSRSQRAGKRTSFLLWLTCLAPSVDVRRRSLVSAVVFSWLLTGSGRQLLIRRPCRGCSRPAYMSSDVVGWHSLVHVVSLCFAVLYGQIQASADQHPGELRGNQPWRSTCPSSLTPATHGHG
jgi:hypothetical protein